MHKTRASVFGMFLKNEDVREFPYISMLCIGANVLICKQIQGESACYLLGGVMSDRMISKFVYKQYDQLNTLFFKFILIDGNLVVSLLINE